VLFRGVDYPLVDESLHISWLLMEDMQLITQSFGLSANGHPIFNHLGYRQTLEGRARNIKHAIRGTQTAERSPHPAPKERVGSASK
jgi:hypothetical protein